MVFLKKSQLSILKIPHFHVSSVDFVDCLIVYNSATAPPSKVFNTQTILKKVQFFCKVCLQILENSGTDPGQ